MAISSKGKGKSGGSRVITCIKVMAESVFLLSIFDKGNKESINNDELDVLLKRASIL